MKVVEIGQVLAVTSKIYEEAGNTEVARGILTVAQLLQDYRVGTVTAFVGQLKRELTQRRAADDNTQKPQGAAGTVKIFEIRAVLDKLGFIYVSSGAKSQAGDCMRLSEMLGDHEGELVETFAKRARDALFQKNQNNIAQTETEGLDAGKYAPMLLAAGTNELTFNAAFSAIRSDRGVTKPILDAIANRYLNEPSGSSHAYKFKTKGHAFEAIKNKFFERAQAETKGEIIDRLMRRP